MQYLKPLVLFHFIPCCKKVQVQIQLRKRDVTPIEKLFPNENIHREFKKPLHSCFLRGEGKCNNMNIT